MAGLVSLKQLWAYGNQLQSLPADLMGLPAIKSKLSAVCGPIVPVMPVKAIATSAQPPTHLQSIQLDGQLMWVCTFLTCTFWSADMWLEGNPLHPGSLVPLLRRLASEHPPELREIGLDTHQVRLYCRFQPASCVLELHVTGFPMSMFLSDVLNHEPVWHELSLSQLYVAYPDVNLLTIVCSDKDVLIC